ncbi:MAG: PD-(D/E)XK nuclease family protein [Nitrospinota bacterium]|nr:PD-(D/E)XK nuclease family protein [Nitrospinota bacterium]
MPIPVVEGAVVLTSGPRLSRWLHYQYGEQRRQEGSKCWATPSVFTLTTWLETLWQQSWPRQHLLSRLQSTKLWETLIQDDLHAPKPDLLHLQGAARRADEAYRFIRQYLIPIEPDSFRWTHETETFLRWLKQYENRLNEWRALDPVSLPDVVKEGMRTSRIPLPGRRLIFAGFEEMTPQLLSLLEFLQSNQVVVEHQPEPMPQQASKEIINGREVAVREYWDPREESTQCARWIRTHPGKTVGVVDLNQYNELLTRELAAELAPQSVFPWTEAELPFGVSAATPLAQEPMVQLVLSLICTASDPVPFTTFSSLLQTPFLPGAQSEAVARNTLDFNLRRTNTGAVFLNRLDAKVNKEEGPHLKLLLTAWKEMLGNPQQQIASAWAHYFSDFLRQIGWPAGTSTQNSKTAQTHQAWTECLDAFASLDRVTGTLTRHSAATLLKQLAKEKPFLLKTHDQPVQVVGLEESAGMKFDCLWVMGCVADNLPAAPSPNPFIPAPLKKNLPHSNSDWELKFAERAIGRLLRSSQEIVFSYPRWDEKTELQMSPLLKSLAKAEAISPIETSHRIADQWQQQPPMEIYQEQPYLAFTAGEQHTSEKNVSPQGYGVLKNQAQCPFRAFSLHRLHADKLAAPETNIEREESRARGNLVHNALDIFWNQVKNRSQLQNLKETDQLQLAICNSVQKAIDKTFNRSVLSTQPFFIKLEFERVTSLLKHWLDEELLRPDFEVLFKEESQTINIGGLPLNIRIDRMDQVVGNQLLLIDDKTGSCNPKDWFQKRVQEPQLPLYALKFLPDAIAYAAVQKDKKKFGWKTIARNPADLKDGKTIGETKATACTDWQEQMDRWKENLTALAAEFLSGKLEINPFERAKTCRKCGLNTLCRIDELDSVNFDAEEIDS